MSVYDADAKALGGNRKIGLRYRSVREFTEDLLGLDLDFRLLARDVGHDVIDDIKGRDAWIARPRDRLHCSHNHRFDTESSVQSGERWRKTYDGAIRICDNKALRESAIGLLFFDQADVIVIDLGDQKRNVLVHSIAGRIGNYGVAGAGKGLFGLTGDGRREARKHD